MPAGSAPALDILHKAHGASSKALTGFSGSVRSAARSARSVASAPSRRRAPDQTALQPPVADGQTSVLTAAPVAGPARPVGATAQAVDVPVFALLE